MTHVASIVVAAALLASASTNAGKTAGKNDGNGAVRDGDRVVFLGDSITVAHTYMRYLEEYLKLRHPEWSLTFINAGIGGHTAFDGWSRIETDVVAQRPTVVFVNFGMNDSSYPPTTDGAALEKYMTAIVDRLRETGVRSIVIVEPTPYDVGGLAPTHWNARRDEKLERYAMWERKLGAERKLVVVPWHQKVNDALTSWKDAGRNGKSREAEKETFLLPDRVHPNMLAHAVMAAVALSALGFDVSSSTVNAVATEQALQVPALSLSQPWDGRAPVTIDVSAAAPPVPFVVDAKDAVDLGNAELAALRSMVLTVAGLRKDAKYRVTIGPRNGAGFDAGEFSGAQLSRGVDVFANAAPRPEPPKDARPTLSECESTSGNPWQNDFDCLFDMLYEKDQLRILMRHEKVRALPDFVPDKLSQFLALQTDWIAMVDHTIELKARALRTKPHTITITPQ